MLLPEHVVRKTFVSSRFGRGYNVKQVDDFLDEVVHELRRLHARIDELEAERRSASEAADQRPSGIDLAHEREQLEQIRVERRGLVSEIEQLQQERDRLDASLPTAKQDE